MLFICELCFTVLFVDNGIPRLLKLSFSSLEGNCFLELI